MMKLRKWSSLNKAEKLGRKNAFKVSFLYAIFIFIVLILSFICIALTPNIGFILAVQGFMEPFSLIAIIFLQFVTPILCYITSKNYAINCAYNTISKNFSKSLAEKMLVRGKPTKVNLIRTRSGYYHNFLLKDLSTRVDYYAVLEINRNIIVIYAKFSDENEKDFFDEIRSEKRNPFDFIEMEEFSSFCEVL